MAFIRANAKACPKCGMWVMKMSGCNHMTCTVPNCGEHFCYVCAHGARTGGEIYAHMRQAGHG